MLVVTSSNLNRLKIHSIAGKPCLVLETYIFKKKSTIAALLDHIIPYYILNLTLIVIDKCSYHPSSRELHFRESRDHHRYILTWKGIISSSLPLNKELQVRNDRWERES